MENRQEERKIEIGSDSLKDLDVVRKWTMFLAIMGFIGAAVVFLIGIIAFLFLYVFKTSESVTGLPESLFFLVLAAISLLYFFPVRYLYLFSRHIGSAIRTLDATDLKKAIKNLKRLYVFIGILLIVILSFYVIAFIAAGSSLTFFNSLK